MRGSAIALLVICVGSSSVGCDLPDFNKDAQEAHDVAKDPITAAEDFLVDQLACQDTLRPSTLARIRAVLAAPDADTWAALATNPEDLAGIVSIAGPEAEGGIVVIRNVLHGPPGIPDLSAHGWDGIECGDPVTLECTAGEETASVTCVDDIPTRIDLDLRRCIIAGTLADGSISLVKDGDDATAIFNNLAVNETKAIDGSVELQLAGSPHSFAASVCTGGGLRIIDHGGPDGGLSCGEELRIDTLAFSADDNGLSLALKGDHRTTTDTYGVATFGNNLHFNDTCACPLPGSGIAFDMPRPLGIEDTTAHVKVSYGAATHDACSVPKVELSGWPSQCIGDSDCAQAATEKTMAALLGAFCGR